MCEGTRTIVGAFIAAVFGLIGSYWSRRQNGIDDLKGEFAEIYNRLDNTKSGADSICSDTILDVGQAVYRARHILFAYQRRHLMKQWEKYKEMDNNKSLSLTVEELHGANDTGDKRARKLLEDRIEAIIKSTNIIQ